MSIRNFQQKVKPPRIFIVEVGIRDPATGRISPRKPVQRAFHDGSRGKPYCLFGGGYGSSKTTGDLLEVAEDVLKALTPSFVPVPLDPPYKALLISETIETAYSALVEPFKSIFPTEGHYEGSDEPISICKENGQKKRLIYRFPKSEPKRFAVIEWAGVPDFHRIMSLQKGGRNYDKILLDQADSIPNEAIFDACALRLGRRPGMTAIEPQFLLTSNPCKTWVYTRFVKKALPPDENPDLYFFLNSQTWDNDSLGERFLSIVKNMSPEKRRVYANADWEFTKGMVYEDYNPLVHIIQGSLIPFEPTWKINCALDKGFSPDPFAVVWYAQDHDGNTFVFREDEGYKLGSRAKAECVMSGRAAIIEELSDRWPDGKDRAGEMFGRIYGPPDMNQLSQEEQGRTAADLMLIDPNDPAWRGVVVDVVAIKKLSKLGIEASGIENINALLKIDPTHKHPITGELGAPRLYFSNKCPRTIAQISQAMYDEPERPGFMRRDKVRNTFAEDDQTHHWDLESACRLMAQQVRFRGEVADETPTNPVWKELDYDALMRGRTKRNF